MMDKEIIGIKNIREIEIIYIFLVLILTSLITLSTFYCFHHSISAVFFPFDIDYGEGIQLHLATMIYEGKNTYQDIYSYPFIACNYPPLYPLVSAGLISVLGKSFLAGRLISFIASLLLCFLIYRIVKEETDNTFVSVISSLIFLSLPHITSWCPLFRIDTLSTFFCLSGIYIVYRYEGSRNIYPSIPIFILAIYTKQSAIVTSFVAFLYLFFKNKKLGLKWLCIFLLISATIFLIINQVTNGQFYFHTIRYNVISFNIQWMLNLDFLFIMVYAIFLCFAIIYYKNSKSSLLHLYFLISLASTWIMAGREGSQYNYFIESMAVMCIFTGCFLNREGIAFSFNLREEFKKERSYLHVLIVALMIFQLLIFSLIYTYPSGFYIYSLPDERAGQEIYMYAANAKGQVLVEDLGFAILNDKDALIDSFLMHELEKKGLWNSSKLVEDCKAKKFSLIIFYWRFNSFQELRECIDENYEKVDEIYYRGSNYLVYKPR